MWPEKQAKAQKARNPLQGGTAGAAAAASPSGPQFGPNPVGRPPTNLGKYLLEPSETDGWNMTNVEPEVLAALHKKTLASQRLPPKLQTTRFRTPVLEHGVLGRATNISRGFRKPQGGRTV
jgi:hypothetical protein